MFMVIGPWVALHDGSGTLRLLITFSKVNQRGLLKYLYDLRKNRTWAARASRVGGLDGRRQAGEAGRIYGVFWKELRKSCIFFN
jgi:hypothetical protein